MPSWATIRRNAGPFSALARLRDRFFAAPGPESAPANRRFSSRPRDDNDDIEDDARMAAQTTPARRLENPVIFICDIQEKFRNAIWEFDKVVLTAQKVVRAAQALSIPIYATTQNRARLGATVPELDELLTAAGPLLREHSDKTKFSMWTPSVERALVQDLRERVAASSSAAAAAEAGGGGGEGSSPAAAAATVAIVGIESHICVTQTALDLVRAGHRVYVLADGVSSCNREEVPLALARLRHEGAVVTSSESWLYEVMGDAAVPEFRAVVGLVKDTSAGTAAALRSLLPAIPAKM